MQRLSDGHHGIVASEFQKVKISDVKPFPAGQACTGAWPYISATFRWCSTAADGSITIRTNTGRERLFRPGPQDHPAWDKGSAYDLASVS